MKTRIASLSLLTVCCLMLAVAPATASTLYANEPDGCGIACYEAEGWTINFGYSVSDSFTVPNNSHIRDLHFIYWDANGADVLSTVDMAIGSTSFGGTFLTLPVTTNDFLFLNAYGYEIFQANFTLNPISIPWSGMGWITLQNACTTLTGCSSPGGGTTPIYWDENSGPSMAYENSLGSIPSEHFTLTDTSGTTPEPSSIMLFGSGILGLAGVLRRRLMR